MPSIAAAASTILNSRSTVMRNHMSWMGSPAGRSPAASLKSRGLVSTRCPSTSKRPSARRYPRISIERRWRGSRSTVGSSPINATSRRYRGLAHHADRLGELLAGLEALLVVLLERLVDERHEHARQRRVVFQDRGVRGVGDGEHELRHRLALERELAAQHLVERDPEREEVAPAVDLLARELLGRHVRRRAQHHAG